MQIITIALIVTVLCAVHAEASMPGGSMVQNKDDGKVFAEWAMGEHGDPYHCHYDVTEMLDYKTQVVAGVSHKLKYYVESKEGTHVSCAKRLCTSNVIEQVWMDPPKKVASHACHLKEL